MCYLCLILPFNLGTEIGLDFENGSLLSLGFSYAFDEPSTLLVNAETWFCVLKGSGYDGGKEG